MAEMIRSAALAALLAGSVAGCGTVGAVKKTILGSDDTGPKVLTGYIGGAVADEPRAALAAKDVLALGGNAADAAVTLGFMLSVTLPSRASLGAGGVCLAYRPGENGPGKGAPEAILFPPAAPSDAGGERPAAVPMLARGLYLLSARYGSENFASLIRPAQDLARGGFPMSRALATDLAPVEGPLTADPAAAAVFAPGGRPLGEGGLVVQPDLATTLTQIAAVGVGDMYQGLLAQKLREATRAAGGPVSVADLRDSRAMLAPVMVSEAGADRVAFPPAPADGPATQAAFNILRSNPAAYPEAEAASGSTAAAQRGAPLPSLPASTSFVVTDRHGGAVACAVTMNNLFGTGRIAPGTGILLAASPQAKPPALLPAAIAWSQGAFRAAIAGSGQNAAAAAVAYSLAQALAGGDGAAPDPGRTNVISCPGGVPGSPGSCRFSADPRGAGLAAVGGR